MHPTTSDQYRDRQEPAPSHTPCGADHPDTAPCVMDGGTRLRSPFLRRSVSRILLVIVSSHLIGVSACDRHDEEGSDKGTPATVTRTAQEGPVTLTLSARPGELPFNERAQVVVEVLADRGVTVDVGDFEQTLSDSQRQFEYRVASSDRRTAIPTDDDRLRWTYRYELEFFLPGEYELPPPTVTFVDERDRGDDEQAAGAPASEAEVQELTTDPLTIFARETGGAPLTPEELQEIATLPPVELAEPWTRLWWIVPALLAVILALALLLARRRRRRRAELAYVMPAHEWARRQIAALVAEKLIAQGRGQEFYYRISGIVRGYIERRYRVLAMEMTTEEFLIATASDIRFGERATTELRRFSSACDLVKYARHEPASAEADALLQTAGDFVERTRETVSRTDEEETQPVSNEGRAA